ncbi:MAG: hypothetical protein Q4C22_05955 [Bacillota bacterium]|nr:hypothetical protein [Bacillota bacterium]
MMLMKRKGSKKEREGYGAGERLPAPKGSGPAWGSPAKNRGLTPKAERVVSGQRGRRALALALAALLLLSPVLAGAVLAAEGNTPKEEVVYINLNGDGSVDKVYVVNIFDLDEDGRIIDYGDYTALRNMTTSDELIFENQTVLVDAGAGRLYYEGVLNSSVIPWVFDIRYYLDGAEYEAEELAGRSGAFRLAMAVKQNPDCDSVFFDKYALQATFTLDTALCSDIGAEGATAANVGGDRQLTYIIVPGSEKEIEITADVKDFEMAGIAINGVSMEMDMDLELDGNEDLQALQDGAEELDDGARELDEGAGTLHDGVEELDEGVGELMEGADELADGAGSLYDGAAELDDGAKKLRDGAEELEDGADQLLEGASDLRSGAQRLYSGAGELYSGLNALQAQNSTLQTMSSLLYGQALSMYGGALSAVGHSVGEGSTAAELTAMMETRRGTLLGDAAQEQAVQDAIGARMGELSAIAGDTGGNYTPEEMALAQVALNYWGMTLVLQGMEQYQEALGAALAAAGDDPQAQAQARADCAAAYTSVLREYEALLAPYLATAGGDQTTAQGALLAAYSQLEAQVGAAEQGAVEGKAAATLTTLVSGDSVYQALAALCYYKGVIEYTDGVAAASSGAAGLVSGARSLTYGAARLYSGAEDLLEGSRDLLDALEEMTDGTGELLEGTLELHDGVLTLRDGVIALEDGTVELLDGVLELGDGTRALCDGTLELLDGAIELLDGTVRLHDGTVTLADGTLELRDKTTTASLQDKIEKMLDRVLGGDLETVSFASPKNTGVEFVQFVIKTPAISIPQAEAEPEEEEPMNFWQRLTALFRRDTGE